MPPRFQLQNQGGIVTTGSYNKRLISLAKTQRRKEHPGNVNTLRHGLTRMNTEGFLTGAVLSAVEGINRIDRIFNREGAKSAKENFI